MSIKSWETYEQVATYILGRFKSELGLDEVEGKQVLKGFNSDTEWEIDAKGIMLDKEAIVIVECKRYTTKKVNQEVVAGVAYRIQDLAAKGGILVSPLGLQEGAKKVAQANDIIEVKLQKDSTPEIFQVEFLDKVIHGGAGSLKAGDAQVAGAGMVTTNDCG